MVGHVFTHLPLDLQILILFDWLHDPNGVGFMRILSCLDLACSKAHQSSWRCLVRHIPSFGSDATDPLEETEGTLHLRSLTNSLQWLSDCQVQLKTIRIIGKVGKHELTAPPPQQSLHLLFVQNLICAHSTTENLDQDAWVAYLLPCCPNLKALYCTSLPPINAHLPLLESLCVMGLGAAFASVPNPSVLIEALDAVGLQLRRLELQYKLTSELALVVGQCCPSLRALYVGHIPLESLIELLSACKQLSEIGLDQGFSTEQEYLTLANVQQIRELRIVSAYTGDRSFHVFVQMLELNPNIECLCFAEQCKYTRSEELEFQYQSRDQNSAIVTMLELCSTVHKLTISILKMDDETALTIATMLAGRLHVLTVCSDQSHPLQVIIEKCGAELTSLDMMGQCVTDAVLRLIGKSCVQLKSLAVQNSSKVTDEGMLAVFQGCVHIENLYLQRLRNTTNKVLQGIVDCGLALKCFQFGCMPSDRDEDWLRQQFKEKQMLPAPAKRCDW